MKIGFDNQKYLSMQSEHIMDRLAQFGGKLYLEFGGKLFDDFHASRVLPGFEPDSKVRMLLQLKDQAEIVIAINAADIEKNKVVVVRRDNREKIVVSLDEIAVKLREILEQEQQDMYNRAEEFLNSHIDTATTMDEMVEKFKANRGFVKACWCGDPECEGEVKYQTGGAATRCLIEDEEFISDKCIYCGKPAKHMAYWGKSY